MVANITLDKEGHKLFTPGKRFENRVVRGEHFLDLKMTSVAYNDNGWYVCYCDGAFLQEVQLVVLVSVVVGKPALVGLNFTLHCYGLTAKQTPDNEVHIYWKKDEENVLSAKGPHLTYGPGFENRVFVRAGLSISQSAQLLGFSRTTISMIYKEWCEKGKTSSMQQSCGRKCLVDARGQRRMGRLIQADRRPIRM
uniref:Ig-like domain-containing protein n=1 Tax=Esox lucius TaxID=8010 RepID=A0AAY5K1D2_ESOLU